MEYNNLLSIADKSELTVEERDFVFLHEQIMAWGGMTANCLVEVARKLKEMRDKKLYQYAGFETFGEYTEKAVGIKERHAYNYIAILEKLPEQFLQSNAKIGVTKLSLLASLSDKERTEIVESVDVNGISVRELKEEIEKRDKKIEQLSLELEQANEDSKNDEPSEAEKELYKQLLATQAELEDLKVKNNEENKAEANKKAEENKKLQEKLKKSEADLKEAKAKIKDLQNKPAETVTKMVENPETTKALEEEKAKASSLENEIETLRKQLTIANDSAMTKFKVKFDDFQRLGAEMFDILSSIPADKQEKCKNAMRQVFKGWNL